MSATLTPAQRAERLAVRLASLAPWRQRAHVTLDEWRVDGAPLAQGERWPRHDGAHTLTHPAVTVPPEWPLDECHLDLDLGGEALLTLHHDQGSERFGHDPYHQRFALRAREVSIEAEIVPRRPFGVPHPDPRVHRATLVWEDTALAELWRLLDLVRESAVALGEHEVVPALLACAERALASLDLPSASDDVLARAGQRGAFDVLWRAPEGLPEQPAALSEPMRERVRDTHARLQAELRALQERYPPQGAFRLSGHAHLDLAWLWPIDESRRKLRRTAATTLALLRRDPAFTFNQSHAAYYEWLAEDDPGQLDEIVRREAEGRWESVGGMWVETDTLMPTGESLARQLLYGQRAFERRFGRLHDVAWLPDCFGFAPGLPQLLRQAGIDAFFTTKTNWNETNRFPHDLFWWEGLDGSRVLSHTFFNQRDAYNGLFEPATLLAVWRHYRGKHHHPEGLLTLGYGDGGGGVTSEMLERQRAAAVLPVLPRTRWGRVDEHFAALRESARRERLPVWLGAIDLELHRGTLSSQGRTKRLHRRAERALIGAETLAALAHLRGGPAPASLEPHWRTLLTNQFHDILPGSSIGEVYERAERELAEVAQAADAVRDAALERLAQDVPAGETAALLVVNPELQPRPLRVTLPAEAAPLVPGAQRVADGLVLCGPERIPGLSVTSLRPSGAPAGLSVSERHLENDLLRVELAEDGTLASVYDRRAGREVLAGRGNQLWVYVDEPRAWDAWDVDVDYRDQGEELRELASRRVIERGPHRAAIAIERRYRDSVIRQELRLWANSARLDIVTHIVWRERHRLLKARFPLAVRAESATYETAFGVVRRPTHANTSWDAARFEVAAHRFADLSESGYGVALLNDGRYGHHALPSELGLTLLRSPAYPHPRADEGEHRFTYALLPHEGDWYAGDVLAEAEDLNAPLAARALAAAGTMQTQPLRLAGAGVALGALKPVEDGAGLVLRVYEPYGARGPVAVTAPDGWRVGERVDLLERPSAGGVALRPFEVASWRLEREP